MKQVIDLRIVVDLEEAESPEDKGYPTAAALVQQIKDDYNDVLGVIPEVTLITEYVE